MKGIHCTRFRFHMGSIDHVILQTTSGEIADQERNHCTERWEKMRRMTKWMQKRFTLPLQKVKCDLDFCMVSIY